MSKQTKEIRIVINQAGAYIELHGHLPSPVRIGKLSTDAYREEAIRLNPDMRHATWGQLVQGAARKWFDAVSHSCEGLTLSPHLWTYNASADSYEKA
jgi:hypothetical protein